MTRYHPIDTGHWTFYSQDSQLTTQGKGGKAQRQVKERHEKAQKRQNTTKNGGKEKSARHYRQKSTKARTIKTANTKTRQNTIAKKMTKARKAPYM